MKLAKKVIKEILDHQVCEVLSEFVARMVKSAKKVYKELLDNLVLVVEQGPLDHQVLMVHQVFLDYLVELDNLVDLACPANLVDQEIWDQKEYQAMMENAVFQVKMVFQVRTVEWECQVRMETVAKLVQVDHKDHLVIMAMMEFLDDVVGQVRTVFPVLLEHVDQMENPDLKVKLLLARWE